MINLRTQVQLLSRYTIIGLALTLGMIIGVALAVGILFGALILTAVGLGVANVTNVYDIADGYGNIVVYVSMLSGRVLGLLP